MYLKPIYFHFGVFQYPFLLSPVFLTYQSRYELRLKLELIQSLSNPNLKKEFHTEQFFQQLKKTKKSFIDLKILLITLLNQLYKSGIIYSKIKIIFKNGETQLTQIKTLKTITVTKSQVLILYEQHKQIKIEGEKFQKTDQNLTKTNYNNI